MRLAAAIWLLVVLGLAATPARALTCRQWQRLDDDGRVQAIDRMIDRVVRSHVAQQYHVSKSQVARCLENNTWAIADAFDDTCSDRRSAGMQALNNVFNTYVWSCVR